MAGKTPLAAKTCDETERSFALLPCSSPKAAKPQQKRSEKVADENIQDVIGRVKVIR